ncbi:MAG: 4Fe-4S binding protein [Spirochaetaceae bacterium]|nr:4Fe-4S binding protein [Spirochaetaceae bacterium]
MTKENIIKKIKSFTEQSESNFVSKEKALSPNLVGMKIYDPPLVAFASASDELFLKMKEPEAIGSHFMTPLEWIANAKTVISIFFPSTDNIRESNKQDMLWPSNEWMHGRIEGQSFIKNLCLYLKSELEISGYDAISPSFDNRFISVGEKGMEIEDKKVFFTSNWSERHIAYVCGHGTFGLSKGLITEKGMAGRFGSVITSLEIKPDTRKYDSTYEYCTMCGKCIKNCPAHAINKEEGKNHFICSKFLDTVLEKHKPWYGCGKCQVNVPCEKRVPNKFAR